MEILWFCNVMLPRVAQHLSMDESSVGGWLVGLSDCLLEIPDIGLSVAFPVMGIDSILSGVCGTETTKGKGIKYYGLPKKRKDAYKYNKKTEIYAEEVIIEVNPDVVHIFGTEFPHALAIVNACERLGIISRVLINIQGLVSVYAKHYCAGLPSRAVNGYTLRDIIRQDNIRQGRKGFEKRGKYEIEAIKKVHHVSGRTDWDMACTMQINTHAQYHFCKEILRDEFYKHSWDIAKCERHSIFISQADYPIKGLHFMLEAMPEIIKRFPNVHLYIAGPDLTKEGMPFVQRLKITYYGVYIKRLIKKYQLRKHITFTGMLDERAMCDRFLKSHVFVLSSSVENSPNSLGEAMLLGVPSIASDVGGVKNLMIHNEDGYIYQHDAPYMLAYYVCSILSDDGLALRFSQNAKTHAGRTHNREMNVQTMTGIYKYIEKK